MRLNSWFLLVAGTLLACHSEKKQEILSREEMVKVLAEIYTTEEKISRLGLNPDSAAQAFDIVQARIFKATGVTDSAFKRSLAYYTDHPVEMEKLYTVLIDSLQLREQRTTVRPEP